MKTPKFKKFLTGLLYCLPVIFFVICYFLITATEEDIAQGAGTTPAVWHDLAAAFRNNGRLADMYAWAVINFFDYQFSFGVDTIFRLIDLVAAFSMLALLASIVLGRRPRFELKDACLVAGIFLLIFLTPYGYTFYRGFSMIHNYLIIALALIGFSLPFLRKIMHQKTPRVYKNPAFAIFIGLVFGLSANFPPLAFLATYLIVKLWQIYLARKNHQKLSRLLPEPYEWCMIIAMLFSLILGYVFGPGVSGYAKDPVYTVSYDYVAFSDLLGNFGSSLVRIFKHIVVNFGRTLLPIVIFLGLAMVLAFVQAKRQGRTLKIWPEGLGTRKLLAVLVIFGIFSVLAGSQIIMPIRLCLPAYLSFAVFTVIMVINLWQNLKAPNLVVIGSIFGLAMLSVVLIRGFFAWDFHQGVGAVLAEIRDSEDSALCINLDDATQRFKTPFSIFQQEETFVERRTTPSLVFGKEVYYCQLK